MTRLRLARLVVVPQEVRRCAECGAVVIRPARSNAGPPACAAHRDRLRARAKTGSQAWRPGGRGRPPKEAARA